jgi:hypothetical protein
MDQFLSLLKPLEEPLAWAWTIFFVGLWLVVGTVGTWKQSRTEALRDSQKATYYHALIRFIKNMALAFGVIGAFLFLRPWQFFFLFIFFLVAAGIVDFVRAKLNSPLKSEEKKETNDEKYKKVS